ncbi:MAG: hypothetical protein ABEH88_04895 [Halobacteriales archaeon]
MEDYRTTAVGALADREYQNAGDAYTRAGWDQLAEPREGRSPFEADKKGWVGRALQQQLLSGLCYRVAGVEDRATRRACEGIAVTRDLEHALDRPGQHACLREFVADFRVVGGLENVDAAYEAAESAYRSAGDAVTAPRTVATTPLFQAAAAPLKQVARGLSNGEIAVSWEDLHGPDPNDAGEFLARRVGYKRQRFPGLLEGAIEAGTLAAPRGTTAYDNASFRCPNCSATDVNWVRDHVLCLRCSTPMVEK